MSKPIENELLLKTRIFENLANITRSMASPARLRILQILSHKPITVEALSLMANETVGNTSQHLQKMLKSGLVSCEKNGVSRIYSLANHKVLDAWLSLQTLATDLVPQIQADEDKLCPPDLYSEMALPEILKTVKAGKSVIVDARTPEEFAMTPAQGAIPISNTLPKSKTVFVFCRGRYCVLANPIVLALRKKGYQAYRLKETAYQINQAS